jgi:predicted amidohydrolase YtcJ
VLTYSDEEIGDFVLEAHKAGLQIGIHAIGDRAIEQVLRAYENSIRIFPRENHRHRIEHLELPRLDQIKRIADAGISVTVQPMFIPMCAGGSSLGYFRTLLGDERIKMFHPYRMLIDLGILVAGGSDSPVTPYAPLESILWASQHPIEDNRISVEEGFKLFTINAAKIGFEEKEKGSIEPGKLADFVVLSDDPLDFSGGKISKIRVDATIVGGEVVFKKEQ